MSGNNMQAIEDSRLQSAARSYHQWWQLAGVEHCASETPHDWLAPSIEPRVEHSTTPIRQAETDPAHPIMTVVELPATLEEYFAGIKSGKAYPGIAYGSALAVPHGVIKPEYLLISDMPDMADVGAGKLLSGPTGALVSAMLHALGTSMEVCFSTALALSRSATGELPDSDHVALRDFMLHMIGVINPSKIIVLGNITGRILLGDNFEGGSVLQNINHDERQVPLINIYHPRTLLARPSLKQEMWRNLQMIQKRD
jgi:uracil-DNA glycosylase